MSIMCNRYIMRIKLLGLFDKRVQQRVYILFINKGFICLRPCLSRAKVLMYLFRRRLINQTSSFQFLFNIELHLINQNSIRICKAYMKASEIYCVLEASQLSCKSNVYSHLVSFTLSYPLVSLSPLLGGSSQNRLVQLGYRFRTELAYLIV